MIPDLTKIHHSIATDVWPHGAILGCGRCGHTEPITTEQAGRYLKTGWPQHCGATMACGRLAPEEHTP